MSELDLNQMDKVLKEKIEFFTKLLNTKPEVIVDFFVDVGFKILMQSESELKIEFDNFVKKVSTKYLPPDFHWAKEEQKQLTG